MSGCSYPRKVLTHYPSVFDGLLHALWINPWIERKDIVEWGHEGHNKDKWDMPVVVLTAASNCVSTPDIKGFFRTRGLRTESSSALGQPLRDVIKDIGFFIPLLCYLSMSVMLLLWSLGA